MSGPKWHQGRIFGFDLETTGIDVHSDRIVTAAIVDLKPDHRPHTRSWIIDPGVDIPTVASDIHGWTHQRIRDAIIDPDGQALRVGGRNTIITRKQALFEVAGLVALAISTGTPLIAFNASFDLSLLEAECRRHGVETLTERLAPKGIRGVVDPFVIDKHYSRRKGPRKLSNQVEHYKVILAGAHDASSDALAAARLIPRMVAAYPELAGMSLARLHEHQVGWRAAQMDSLRSYFDRVGTAHDGCCGEWPLHVACQPVLAEQQGALL